MILLRERFQLVPKVPEREILSRAIGSVECAYGAEANAEGPLFQGLNWENGDRGIGRAHPASVTQMVAAQIESRGVDNRAARKRAWQYRRAIPALATPAR